jgi:hypothetical protein
MNTSLPDGVDELGYACSISNDLLLDLVLTERTAELPSDSNLPEAACLSDYQNTTFEQCRRKIEAEGLVFKGGELGNTDFLNSCFLKVFRYALTVEIVDRLFGEKFGDNYEYTTKNLIGWFEGIIDEPDQCVIEIHCGDPQTNLRNHMKTEVGSYRTGRIRSLPITIYFYDPNDDQSLPHARLIVTDQVALNVDRGMDFLCKDTKSNRDVSIDYKDYAAVQDILKNFGTMNRNTVPL